MPTKKKSTKSTPVRTQAADTEVMTTEEKLIQSTLPGILQANLAGIKTSPTTGLPIPNLLHHTPDVQRAAVKAMLQFISVVNGVEPDHDSGALDEKDGIQALEAWDAADAELLEALHAQRAAAVQDGADTGK